MGRLVLTHSTYIEGLIEWLKILAKDDQIKNITPSVIGKVKGRSDILKLQITRKTSNGYKLKARKGKSNQEVYIVCKLSEKELERKIENSKP